MQPLPRDNAPGAASATAAMGAESPSSAASLAFGVAPAADTAASTPIPQCRALSETVASLALLGLDTLTLKAGIKLFNVQGLANAPSQAKLIAVATRMLQYGFSVTQLSDALTAKELMEDEADTEIVADMSDDDRERYTRQKRLLSRLSKLPRVSASYRKQRNGACEVIWGKGTGAPQLTQVVNGSTIQTVVARAREHDDGDENCATGGTRAPAFSASEYARLLHVLVDARMTIARRLLSRPRDRDELDREPVNPWDDHIAPLFNDSNFAPVACDTVCDGITAADISSIDPSQLPHQRSSSKLSEKWAKLRSEYTKTLDNFQRSGQLECDVFPRFAHGKV
jgi:hypothetical protein